MRELWDGIKSLWFAATVYPLAVAAVMYFTGHLQFLWFNDHMIIITLH